MIITHLDKEYEVKYMKFDELIRNGFHGERLVNFLKKIYIYDYREFVDSIKSYTYFAPDIYTLLFKDNYTWFITQGLATEIKKETKLVPGMILYNSDLEMIVTPDNRLFIGKGWLIDASYYYDGDDKYKYTVVTTLEKFNEISGFTWKIKEV